ncbi:MAG: M23 family metallopeptidase [Candidatus Glassbacteria bacterium]|nr:M23 family metallopeptidase [Candidatus Glassbacteria bacterium]
MKYLTLMIVPYPGADVRSVRIRHRTLKVLGFVLALLVCALIMTVFYLRPVFDKAQRFDQVIVENRNLTLENRKIRELANRLQEIDKLVSKLQVAQGVTKAGERADEAAAQEPEAAAAVAMQNRGGEDLYGAGADTRAPYPKRAGMPYGRPMDEKSFISRNFNPGIYHFGVDFALKQGTPVKATADGVVISAEESENLGLCVIIEHKSGYRTLYGHNSRLEISNGDRVRRGDIIAYSGNTGMSSGPHLHYAIFDENNNPVDPIPFLQ